MLPAAVGSLNYATTPVECCSDVWTNFLHCMTFELLQCVPVFRLDPVCTCVCVCVWVRACVHVCMHVPLCNRARVVLMFVSVEYIQTCVCTVYTHVKCLWLCACVTVHLGLFSAHIYKRICVSPWVHVRARVTETARVVVQNVRVWQCVWKCVCVSGCLKHGAASPRSMPKPYGSHHPL